jgi:transposase
MPPPSSWFAATLTVRGRQHIFLSTEAVDMRGGFDCLAGRVLGVGFDLYAGHRFVFVSRRRMHHKVLTWDGMGMVVTDKRLGRGRFTLPAAKDPSSTVVLDAQQLHTLLSAPETVPVVRSTSRITALAALDSSGRM